MTATPTSPDRSVRLANFATLTEALDFAALGETGVNLYSLRGELLCALPYATLRDEARALAARMLAAGLTKGDRVGLAAETDADFVRSFFACQYAGLIPAPLPLPAPLGGKAAYVEQIGRMLTGAHATAVFGPEALAPWLQEAADIAGARLTGSIAALPEASATELPQIQADDTCYLQFSSGSTRNPTGVEVTHRALMANAQAITRDGLKVTAPDRAVSWLPLYHDMGLVGFLLSPLCAQMSLDLLPTGAFVRRPLLWLDLIGRNGGTISYSPTFGYELCARRAETAGVTGLNLAGWRVAGVGGDMVRTKPLLDFAARFADAGFDATAYVASYGMAEATLGLTMAPLGKGLRAETLDVDRLEQDAVAVNSETAERRRAFARCGPPLAHHELEVRDEDGAVLGERQVGHIFARGPSLMRGYFRQPEETARVMSADGWLSTGDLGFIVDGEIVITGRAKDLILVNGRNVWPQDLEWSAEAEIDVLRSGDVAAISVTRNADEETVVILVQCRTSAPEPRAKLVEDVAALMRARHGLETKVQLVGAHALPQTSSGKLSRSKAKTLFLAGAFGAAAETV